MLQKDERQLRIGVLGAGPIAQAAHFEACRRARNAELYAICDVAEDLLERMAALHQPRKAYHSFEQMLADPEVDAVIVATSDPFHVPLAEQALAAAKHVLIEKPLGVTVEECERLKAAAAQAKRCVQIGFNYRFEPSLAAARRFAVEEMGAPAVLNAWYCDSTERYTMTDNLQPVPVVSAGRKKPTRDPKADKRSYFLATHGSHLLDSARFLAGPIAAVRARWRERSGAHAWSAEIEFENGCLGHLGLMVPARSDFQVGIHLWGEWGSAQGRLYLPWYRKAGTVECFSVRDGTYRKPLGADADTYKLQIEGFAGAALDGKTTQAADLEDGIANMRALVATARACETANWVRLDEVNGGI